ncbi:hypothetical protein [Lacticaseibacillus paracasei]|uniref:hypothetical protein n=1 Tax=Lacticaseibacillus paracasei TaxID=1597 RepID=UPI000D770326|nr:hypothetical protein [Lacticaseibacillus paracasei]AWR91956.1 hypothetical protein DMC16_12935 [Lacticaseibacillus paracasei]MBT9263055.1 hypothetical protein [Lacticaseibacillus paracasei]
MLIKLDSGKLLNISAVSYISNNEMVAYFKQPVITNENSFQTAKCFGVGVTESDIERIAGIATNSKVTDDD